MEVRKELVLTDKEITTIREFIELVWDIANETGFDVSCIMSYLYDKGVDSYTHNLDDIENY